VSKNMGIPATTGVERQNIRDMQIGDYIKVGYATGGTLNALGTFQSVIGSSLTGNYSTSEIPSTGINAVSTQGYFYMVKVDKGVLVADRSIHAGISWDTLNTAKAIEGLQFTLNSITGNIRVLTGGVAWLDVNGNKQTVTQTTGNAFPLGNEFDKYIVNFPTNLIQSGKVINDVFNSNTIKTWCQETPNTVVGANTNRIARTSSTSGYINLYLSNTTTSTNACFRPVFDYIE
jgi:hypothetical protein